MAEEERKGIRFFEFEKSPLGAFASQSFVGFDEESKKERRYSIDDLLLFLGYKDFTQEDFKKWLNVGFTWLDIGVFLLKRENMRQPIETPFLFSRIPSHELEKVVEYIKTPEGFKETGIALCDGTPFPDGSDSAWNLATRFVRAWKPNMQIDGEKILAYQPLEDALQDHLHSLGHPFDARVARPIYDGGSPIWMAYQSSVENSGPVHKDFKVSSETRPKCIFFPFFQVAHKIDIKNFNYRHPKSLSS